MQDRICDSRASWCVYSDRSNDNTWIFLHPAIDIRQRCEIIADCQSNDIAIGRIGIIEDRDDPLNLGDILKRSFGDFDVQRHFRPPFQNQNNNIYLYYTDPSSGSAGIAWSFSSTSAISSKGNIFACRAGALLFFQSETLKVLLSSQN